MASVHDIVGRHFGVAFLSGCEELGRPKCFGECDEGGVVGGEVFAQFPDTVV
jgi:hypothetical protein